MLILMGKYFAFCIRNGIASKLRNDVEGESGRSGEEEEVAEEEEARLVTARVDLASPSVFRDAIQQPCWICCTFKFTSKTKRNQSSHSWAVGP